MRKFDHLLPIEDPTKPENQPSEQSFYDNVAQPLIPHMIDIMLQGINLDLKEVENLRATIDDVLEEVQKSIDSNKIVIAFNKYRFPLVKKAYIKEQTEKQRNIQFYLKPYKPKDMTHRSYVVNEYLFQSDCRETMDYTNYSMSALPNGDSKWSVQEVKKFAEDNPELDLINFSEEVINRAMENLATDKSELYNVPYKNAILDVTPEALLPRFNPSSPQQKSQIFEYLGIESEEFSKETGNPTWDRDQIERVQQESADPEFIKLMQAFIDHSFSAIIKQNFLAAFDKFAIDGVLYGNLKLGGAKSFRLTSNKP